MLDAAFVAAGCGTSSSSDAGTDGTANDGLVLFETGGGCMEAGAPVQYELCATDAGDAGDAGDASDNDACAPNCTVACTRVYSIINSCTDDSVDAGVVTATCVHTVCSAGRRPAGCRKPRATRARPLASWLRASAWMEAVSVHAFERLAMELVAHDAPAWLVREAKRAARDEARHARTMRAFARSRGVRVPAVRFRERSARSLAAVARENAVEGCVNETYGALAAHVQAARAKDPAIRRAMRRIASDEQRHAALALAVADWAEPKLSPAARARIDEARRAARTALTSTLEITPAIPEAGVVGGREARALAASLFAAHLQPSATSV
jgi:rubrerythrin